MEAPKEDKATIEMLINRLNDSDTEWWPFAFMKPEPHERLTTIRCAALALLYGTPAALFGLVAGTLLGDTIQGRHALMFVLGVCAASFMLLQIAMVRSWNRRAQKLQPLHQRRISWKAQLDRERRFRTK